MARLSKLPLPPEWEDPPRYERIAHREGLHSFMERLRSDAPAVTGILFPTRVAIAAAAMLGNPIPTCHVTGDPEPLRGFR